MERLAASPRRRSGGKFRSGRKVSVLAAESGVAVPTLTQHAHFLRIAGLLAKRAPPGTLLLARPPSEISLLEVIRAIDGGRLWKRCLLGLAHCSDSSPCPVHPVWKEARSALEEHLQSQSLADLVHSLDARRRERIGPRGVRPEAVRSRPGALPASGA